MVQQQSTSNTLVPINGQWPLPPSAQYPAGVPPFYDVKSVKKRKPGPLRKKCVWCSLTHGHSCNSNRCAVRGQLGGIGSSDLLERCRILKREVGEEVRIALEREGEAGIAKLERALWDRKLRENPEYQASIAAQQGGAIPTSQSMPNLAAMAAGASTPVADRKADRASSVSPVLSRTPSKKKSKKGLSSTLKRGKSSKGNASLAKPTSKQYIDFAGDKLAILSLVCADMDAQLNSVSMA